MILLNVPYAVPSVEPFDLTALNELTTKAYGYRVFAYWYFTSEEGTRLMSRNPEKVWVVCHGADTGDKNWMLNTFTERDAIHQQILSPTLVPLKEYARNEKLKDAFVDRIKRDGFETWQMYYRSWVDNVQYEAEKVGASKDLHKVNLRVLYIACSRDPLARPDCINGPKDAGLLPNLEQVLIDSSHRYPYEKPQEATNAIRGFLERIF